MHRSWRNLLPEASVGDTEVKCAKTTRTGPPKEFDSSFEALLQNNDLSKKKRWRII